MNIVALIPARMGSRRFSGKPMVKIMVKPMIGDLYDKVKKNQLFSSMFAVTYDVQI